MTPPAEEVDQSLEEPDRFAQQFLERHNQLRKLHCSPEIYLSDELCEMASEWANKIAAKGHVSFAEISGIGENITVFPAEKSANEMVDFWYEENRKYEYETPGWQAGTNYFTQVVWRSTRELGVGRAKMNCISKDIKQQQNTQGKNSVGEAEKQQQTLVVVVAFYRPAGNSNRSGQFTLNVLKPLSSDSYTMNGENKVK